MGLITARQRSVKKIAIKPKLLLLIYAAFLIGFLIIAIDAQFFDSQLKNAGPADPHGYLWFTLIFTLPHIFAGLFGFLEKEYITTYSKRLLRGARYIVLATILLPLISIDLTFFALALYTMSHVFLQQGGVAKSLMRGSNRWHKYWQWSGIAIASVLYISIYSDFQIATNAVLVGLGVTTLAYLFFAVHAVKASTRGIGTLYFWSTCSTPILSGLFLALGYPILTIAIPRVIHDLTAFVFYIAHDHNRFLQSKANIIYRFTSKIGLPIALASPLLAIVIAYPLQAGNTTNSAFMLLMFIFLFHYYTEGFMWKRGSLHRKQIIYDP